MVDELDMHLMRLAIIFLLSLASCAQQSRLNPPEDEREAIRECDRVVFGETNEKRIKSGYVYDTLFKRWLIDERADEISACLVERHGWTAAILPDGRRVGQVPP
jgi:hypothetical protein